MTEKKVSTDRFKISKFKLDALLDITLSINANLPTETLLSKYESILRTNLGIDKILIFKRSVTWECILNGGFPRHFEELDIESNLAGLKDIRCTPSEIKLEGVDIIIPVFNNNIPLAYVLIGDIEEEGEGMSPVLKHLNFIQTLSGIIIVAIENIRLVNESLRQEAMRKELELAARMQMMLIPDNRKMPHDSGIRVTGFYYPHYEVGGDYYDCIRLSDTKTGFCIADVSGKGISAAILMSNFQASLRALFTHNIELETLIRKLNSIILVNSEGERFLTFFVARYDTTFRELEFINAAHNPPVLINTTTGETQLLKASCVGVGMLDEIPFMKTEKIRINGYSKIVCYTDGLSELPMDNGKEVGTEEIIKYISNTEPVEKNLRVMISNLGIPDNNPYLFDDVSIIAADLL
jgi:sigma-B regulation protein RsbU (phosphoserine phosphatase)